MSFHRFSMSCLAPKVAVSLCLVLVASGVMVGCTAKSTGSLVKVTATSDDCKLSTSSLKSGATTFEVTNSGRDVTEVYIYASGNQIMGEVENIGPGSTRSFTTELDGGDYEVACKPGQKGDGIRTALVVVGATTTTEAPSRTIEVTAFEWGYSGFDFLVPKAGQTVKFVMTNKGTVDHEMEILDPIGEPVGEVGPTKPGESGEVVIKFDETGVWVVECGIEGHLVHGMRRTFDVTAS